MVALLLTGASILSFISIRTDIGVKEFKLEQLANNLFLISLAGIFGIIVFMLVNYWNK